MPVEEILEFIKRISPHAMDYVYNSFKNNEVEILYSISTDQNKGVLIKVENEDCCIFYASFLNEDGIEQIWEIINHNIDEYVSKSNLKELCFNIYGGNLKIINLIRELGFKSDMEGYHLEYVHKEMPQLKEKYLINKGFDDSMIEAVVDLFDSSYYELDIENGWETNNYSMNKERFQQKLNILNRNNQVRSFWLNNELIGSYVFEDNYITDIVVKPEFQNKGYGSYMLAHCIRNMRVNKAIETIRLRVVKSNVSAKRLYERSGFTQLAWFAEHTY